MRSVTRSRPYQPGGRRRRLAVGLAVLALTMTACGEVETPSGDDDYHPATVDSADPSAPPTVKFTEDAVRRVELLTNVVTGSKGNLIVDYAALIYDKKGLPWVYAVTEPLTFVRVEVKVKQVVGNTVTLSEGPPPGTEVVTQGATEVYGSELGMEADH
jgi:hypothetical protein